jgi:hypothetical protein
MIDLMDRLPPIVSILDFAITVYFFSFILMTSIFVTQTQVAYAGEKSPYDSGYDHGCDDAKISDPNDRYINQPEKGPSFHTNEFMRGYNDGYDACSNNSGNSDSGDRTDGCFDEGYEDGRDNPFDINE